MDFSSSAELVRWAATGTGIAAAIIVSLRLSPRTTGWGFVIFTVSSISWIAAGFAEDLPSLVVQNAILTAINIIGIYRWMVVKG